jgi:hypothetical protein
VFPERYELNLYIICVFRMILTINGDYFPKQHCPAGLCSGEVACLL